MLLITADFDGDGMLFSPEFLNPPNISGRDEHTFSSYVQFSNFQIKTQAYFTYRKPGRPR